MYEVTQVAEIDYFQKIERDGYAIIKHAIQPNDVHTLIDAIAALPFLQVL
jgi:hypothetical protein